MSVQAVRWKKISLHNITDDRIKYKYREESVCLERKNKQTNNYVTPAAARK